MYIKKIDTMNDVEILLNPSSKAAEHVKEGDHLKLHVGSWKKEVRVFFSEEIAKDVLGVPTELMHPYTIPEDINFDWYVDGDHWFIGPVLGIVRGMRFSNISNYSLKILLRWVTDYKNIGGLIVVFPLSEVQENSESVQGYYFDPNDEINKWKKGVFPFPSAVFNRPIAGGARKYRILEKITEGKFFNSKGSGKWEFYSALSKHSQAKNLVPYTEKFESVPQLLKLLKRYKCLYLKRKYGAKGYGIIQIRKKRKTYEVTRVVKGDQKRESFTKINDFQMFIDTLVKKGRYVIQQGVPYEVGGKQIDFRGYLQKDGSGEWKLREFIGRLAKQESVITNLRYTEKILSGRETLKECYGLTLNEVDQFVKKIEDACLLAGESLDKNMGHYGDVAIDFTVDPNGEVYFLEANSNYGHTSLRKLKDPLLKHRIYRSPLEYAKFLSGFSSHAPN